MFFQVIQLFYKYLTQVISRGIKHIRFLFLNRKFIRNFYFFYLLLVFIFCIISLQKAQSIHNIKVNRIKLYYPNLPHSLKNFTITHLSDTHFGNFMQYSDFYPIANLINDINSDILVISGDLISESKYNIPELIKSLGLLKKHKYGNYCSLGNHDHFVHSHSIKKSIPNNFSILLNEEKFINVNKTKIRIIGIDYPFFTNRVGSKKEQIYQLLSKSIENPNSIHDTFNILISHDPDAFLVAQDKNIHLTLSGHTHGGQISILGINPAKIIFNFYMGIYKKNDVYLYVNPGLSSWFPFRFGIQPEITVITLT